MITSHHPDKSWIDLKINGHGGAWHYKGLNSLAVITYISNKNRLQILGYNTLLYFKYILRNIKQSLSFKENKRRR